MEEDGRRAESVKSAAEGELSDARENIIRNIQEQQPDDEILYDLAELFKVFGNSTRIKILYSMFEHEL